MACGCKRKTSAQFVWTSDPDAEGKTEQVVYSTEIEARAKVIRKGGTYEQRV